MNTIHALFLCVFTTFILHTYAATAANTTVPFDCAQFTNCDTCMKPHAYENKTMEYCGWCYMDGKCMLGSSESGSMDGNCTASQGWVYKTDCTDCATLKNCSSCTNATLCGWCYGSNSCELGTMLEHALIANCSIAKGEWSYQGCELCANQTSCSNCTAKDYCGWCYSDSKCLTGNNETHSLDMTCSNLDGWIMNECMDCSQYTKCGDCAKQYQCGWCSTSDTCEPGSDLEPFMSGVCSNKGNDKYTYYEKNCSGNGKSSVALIAGLASVGVLLFVIFVIVVVVMIMKYQKQQRMGYMSINQG